MQRHFQGAFMMCSLFSVASVTDDKLLSKVLTNSRKEEFLNIMLYAILSNITKAHLVLLRTPVIPSLSVSTLYILLVRFSPK